MHPDIPGARYVIAGFGELVADPSRVAMLLSLLDGLARPASELARIAGVAPSTASAHLARLAEGGLVVAERQGRHRYYRLAGEGIADALEVIARQAAPRAPKRIHDPAREALCHARTCYRHLAGELGVAWLASLEQQHLVRVASSHVTLAPGAAERFAELGLQVPSSAEGKPCLDWTERRPHLGGPLGVALTDGMIGARWLVRRTDTRALRVTPSGRAALARFGVTPEAVSAAS